MEQENRNLSSCVPEELCSQYQDLVKGTFSDSLGMEFIKLAPGYCLAKLPVKPEFLNPLGSIHGGLLFTIADTASGMASVDFESEGNVTTINGDMQFLRAALNLNEVYVEARRIKDGKRIVFTDVQIMTEDGTILAKGSYTFARIILPNVKTPE